MNVFIDTETCFYVYAYYEEGYSYPFYIGKGKDDRAYEHLEPNVLNDGTRFHKKLKSLLRDGFKVEVIMLAENLTEAEAHFHECQYIKQFGRLDAGGCLYNQTDGGDGISGHRHAEETRQKIREARKNQSPPACGLPSFKRRAIVCKYMGQIVKRYDYIMQVKDDGFQSQNVNAVLKGKRKFAHGYEWEYV